MFRSVNVAFRPLMNVFDTKGISSISKCAMVTGTRSFATNTSEKIKHKPPQKRASSLFNTLRKEEFTNMKNGRKWPDFRAGDSIEIEVICYIGYRYRMGVINNALFNIIYTYIYICI